MAKIPPSKAGTLESNEPLAETKEKEKEKTVNTGQKVGRASDILRRGHVLKKLTALAGFNMGRRGSDPKRQAPEVDLAKAKQMLKKRTPPSNENTSDADKVVLKKTSTEKKEGKGIPEVQQKKGAKADKPDFLLARQMLKKRKEKTKAMEAKKEDEEVVEVKNPTKIVERERERKFTEAKVDSKVVEPEEVGIVRDVKKRFGKEQEEKEEIGKQNEVIALEQREVEETKGAEQREVKEAEKVEKSEAKETKRVEKSEAKETKRVEKSEAKETKSEAKETKRVEKSEAKETKKAEQSETKETKRVEQSEAKETKRVEKSEAIETKRVEKNEAGEMIGVEKNKAEETKIVEESKAEEIKKGGENKAEETKEIDEKELEEAIKVDDSDREEMAITQLANAATESTEIRRVTEGEVNSPNTKIKGPANEINNTRCDLPVNVEDLGQSVIMDISMAINNSEREEPSTNDDFEAESIVEVDKPTSSNEDKEDMTDKSTDQYLLTLSMISAEYRDIPDHVKFQFVFDGNLTDIDRDFISRGKTFHARKARRHRLRRWQEEMSESGLMAVIEAMRNNHQLIDKRTKLFMQYRGVNVDY